MIKHELNHSKLGIIKFTSALEDEHLVFRSSDGDYLGSFDNYMGGYLDPILAGNFDFESSEDEEIYLESEDIIFAAVYPLYPGYFVEGLYERHVPRRVV